MTGILLGFMMGLAHRFFVSPFIGKQTYRAQSIGTPAAGVMLAFIPFRVSVRLLLLRIVPDRKMRHDVGLAVDYSYWTVFLFYGLAVVLTILRGIGGVKES